MHPLVIGLSTPSLFGIPVKTQCRKLAAAEFGAIELFLFPEQAKRLPEYRRYADEYDLTLTLHQPWSFKESGGFLLNRILEAFRYLPRNNYTLWEITKDAHGEMCVTYFDRFPEVLVMRARNAEHAFQTATTWYGTGKSRRWRVPYQKFIDEVRSKRLLVVFDTYHVIEWALSAPGGKLLQFDEEELASVLINCWEQIGPEQIVEIHWNDFSRKTNEDARDCLPGEGCLALGLRRLAAEIHRCGWGGTIIPEVSPLHLFPFTLNKLVDLRQRVEWFFK